MRNQLSVKIDVVLLQGYAEGRDLHQEGLDLALTVGESTHVERDVQNPEKHQGHLRRYTSPECFPAEFVEILTNGISSIP